MEIWNLLHLKNQVNNQEKIIAKTHKKSKKEEGLSPQSQVS
jgi:hypothetical protein